MTAPIDVIKVGQLATLEKISIKKGKTSGLEVGYSHSGRVSTTPHGGVSISSRGGYLDGDGYSQTSKIKKIIDKTDDSVTFETETSVYKLTYAKYD